MVPCNNDNEPGIRPRITYSSVIQSLVETLNKRSPFLQDKAIENHDNIALLDRHEVRIGALLGEGNFSNVFEVVGLQLQLQHQIPQNQNETDKLDSLKKNDDDRDDETDQNPPELLELSDDDYHSDKSSNMNLQEQSSRTEVSSLLARDNNEAARILLVDPPHANANATVQSKKFALKCLKPDLLARPKPQVFLEAAADLVIEAQYLTRLNHPNILKVRGLARGWETAFADGEYDSFFLLVDRLEETLNQRIKRWRHGELSNENTIGNKCHIALQIASALQHLHERNLIFRDLKPQNIGLRFGDNTIQLFDFGFCRELPTLAVDQSRDDADAVPHRDYDSRGSLASTLPGGETVYVMSGKGTRRYMAPECLTKSRYNLKADVYSWSMIFWECLTLNKPYCKYSKEQHMLFVCEGGDRPPLEPPVELSTWLPTPSSFHSSLSSLHSTSTLGGDESIGIDFEQSMTEPIKDLLRHAWHQEVSKRLTMKQVCESLEQIIHGPSSAVLNTKETYPPFNGISQLPNGCMPSFGDLVMDFASEFRELSLAACFGPHSSAPFSSEERHSEESNSEKDTVGSSEAIPVSDTIEQGDVDTSTVQTTTRTTKLCNNKKNNGSKTKTNSNSNTNTNSKTFQMDRDTMCRPTCLAIQ